MNFKGKIVQKNDTDYEEARVGRVFNHRRPNRFPEAIFFCALYLASDEASWVTGADFPIDGGASKW
jgi:NAD(P)-dependent dehydrogenase (short-subunit alcohol dehydrogenase family)